MSHGTGMRIALMISAKGWRGSGVSFAKIAQGLVARGHSVLLVTVAPPLTARFKEEGLPVVELPLRHTGLREARQLWRALAPFGPDVVMADTPRDLRLLALATLPLRTPVVYRYNCRPSRAPTRLDDRLFFRRVHALVFLSRAVRDEALGLAPWFARVPSFRIANGFDTGYFAPDAAAGRAFRERHGIAPDSLVVLTPGKLARDKGHETVMHALDAMVRRGGPRVVHVALGDGAREGELRALAARLAVPTIFTGILPQDGVVASLSAADVVVHPSRRETFGNAVAEAMACGRAVVATDGGATAEVLGRDGTTGTLVPVDDPAAMSHVVEELLLDPAGRLRMGSAARERIAREFPLDAMITGYERMFGAVVERARARRRR